MKTFNTLFRWTIFSIGFLFLFSTIGYGQISQSPGTINIQGLLTNPSGQPVANGQYQITFRLYSAALSDVILWSENQTGINVVGGVFNAQLGKVTPFDIPFDKPYFLGIKVGLEPEMNPRIELTSTPYSLMAKNIENNAISTAKIQANAVTVDKILPSLVSSINGVANDGGNVNIIAGANVSIASDNVNKTITISATGGVGGTGSISSLTEGNGIGIQNPAGPFPTIGLKPNILLGPGGSLGILNQNSRSVVNLFASSSNQGGSLTLDNANLLNTIGLTHFSDGQPFFYMNNRLGRQIVDLKANEASDAEMNLKASTGNTVLRFTTNENAGGLVNVFNQVGNVGARLTTRALGDGILTLNSPANLRILELRSSEGGGYLGLFNEFGTESVRLSTTISSMGGILSVFNRAGNEVAYINTDNAGDGQVSLKSGSNVPTIDLGANVNGGGFFGLFNQDGNEMVRISTSVDRQPFLRMNNRLNNKIAELNANEFSDGQFTLNSVLNNPTVQLTAANDAGGLINVFNSNGLITAQLTNTIAGDGISAGNGKLVLNSAANNRVLELRTNTAGGGRLVLNNVEGTEVVGLSTFNTYGGYIDVRNRSGLAVARVVAQTDGDGEMSIRNDQAKEVLYLSASDAKNGFIQVNDLNQSEIVKITAANTGGGFIGIRNRLGNQVVKSFANDFSDGEIELNSVLTNPTLLFTANDNAGGLINVFNQEGNVAARLEATPSGFLGIFNNEKTEMIQLGIKSDQNARITVNNRLGNPTIDLESNDFSDGQIQLYSVLKNPTLQFKANDNAGGLINLFSMTNKISAKISETNGFGNVKIYNPEGRGIAEMSDFNKAGRMVIYNPEKESTERGVASVYVDTASGYGVFGVASKIFSGLAELTGDTKENGFLGLYHSNTGSRSPIVSIGGSSDAEGYMHLFNSSSKAMISLYSSAGDGTIALSNKLGKREASLDGSQFGGTLSLHNAASSLVHLMTTNQANQEGIYSVRSKTDQEKKRLELGGDNIGNGYLNLFNNKGLNTFFMGHNEFGDGSIELKNNLGNLGGFFTAFKDGGIVAVTDGKPGTNHRATMGVGLFGGRTTIFNNSNLLTHESTVQSTGEGITRIVNPNDITMSRVELGGSPLKDGFISTYDNKNKRNIDLRANSEGAGIITTYKNDKIQTTLNATTTGGDIEVFNAAGLNTSVIGHLDDGRGKIEVGHSNGIKVARMTSNTDGSGYIGVDNVDKNEVVRITANTGKGGGIGIKNALVKDIITLSQNQNNGLLLVNNASGNNTSALAHFDDGRGKIEVGSADGTKVVRMTANTDGSGFIGVDNVDKLEVVRITANLGKGGGVALRNDKGADMIKLTQDQSYGAILVNNPAGGLIATVTHNSGGGGAIATKDGKGGDAVLITSNDKGGGNVTTYNDLGKVSASINLNENSQGKILVNGPMGNELASMTGTSMGGGKVVVNNSIGINLAGLTSNTVSGGGYLFANNSTGKDVARMTAISNGNGVVSIDNAAGTTLAGLTSSPGGGYVYVQNTSGKELARMTSLADGTTGRISIDNNTGVNIAGITSSTLGGGYVFANTATGKDVVRMTTLAGGAGYVSTDNPSAKTVNYMALNTNNSGYIGVANATGFDRARLTGTASGAGYMSISNASGVESVALTTSTGNSGIVQTYNTSGAVLTGLESSASGHGLVYASNSAGALRGYLGSGTNGGEVALRDNAGTQRMYLNGSGYLQIDDADGAALISWFSGTGVGFISTDKFQHPRAEFKPGRINVNGTNGGENAFIGAVPGSPHLGYVGVTNGNIFQNPVKAGMYTNASNQGIVFGDMKNFRMDYPGKPDKEIWYGSIEGPELAAYIRGTGKLVNGKATIEFPDHYVQVANAKTMTVILTPLSGKSKGLAAVSKNTTGFGVEELMEGSGTYEFDWEVKCLRKGYEDFQPVRNKTDEPNPLANSSSRTITLQKRSNTEMTVDPVIKENIEPQVIKN